MNHLKPYSQACENNKQPILSIINPIFNATKSVLEIGSGTGQHAVHFAEAMPHLIWQTSDRPMYHDGINFWINEYRGNNLLRPIELDVLTNEWTAQIYDAVFSANTAHIMPWQAVQAMFKGVGGILPAGGRFVLYGPFNYNGSFTSESNARFDAHLRATNPEQGIRHFEEVNRLATQAGLSLLGDIEMPANNRLLSWQK